MAIDVIRRPRPVLPEPPAPADLEVQFDGLQGVRDELADLLTDPFFEPLRAGIDAQLARLYRAIRAADRSPIRAASLYNPAERDLAADVWLEHDAPAGAGDDVESYRG